MSFNKSILHAGSFQPQFKTSLMTDMDINGQGDGVYTYSLDEDTGELTLIGHHFGIINPARFCTSPENEQIFAASDTNDFLNWTAGSGGGVYAFSSESNESLLLRDSHSSCGVRAVDLCCDRSGKYLTVINQGTPFCTTKFFKSGSGKYEAEIHFDEKCVVLFSLNKNGIATVCDRYILPESPKAYPQSIKIDHDNFIFIISSGSDTITVMALDYQSETLIPILTDSPAESKGLYDIVFHPILPIVYCSCLESGEILVYKFDKTVKQMSLILRAYEEEPSSPGTMMIGQNGDFLYTVDSKHGEIKVYAITQEGKLVLFQRKSIETRRVYSFYDATLSKSGKWLIISEIENNELYVCHIHDDGSVGKINPPTAAKTPTGLISL